MPKVKGTIFYTFTNNIDKKYKQWKTTVVLDNKEAKKLHDQGLKTDLLDELNDPAEMCEAGTRKKTFYRKLYKRGGQAGQTNDPPICAIMKDDGSKEWFNGIVGNGSEAWVHYAPYNWDNDFGKGVGADFKGVIITKLVEFEGSESTPDPDDEEFEGIGGERKVKTDFDDDEVDTPDTDSDELPDIPEDEDDDNEEF